MSDNLANVLRFIFAKIAKVDFRDITTYDPFVINKFYGSYYRLTGIERLKDLYEKFIYYTPRNIQYKTEQFKYVVDEKGNPIAKTELKQVDFFQPLNETSSSSYFHILVVRQTALVPLGWLGLYF